MKITDIGSDCFDCHCLLSHWSVFIDHIAIFYLFPLKPPVAKGMARCRVERTKRLMARFTKIDKNDLSSWRRKNKKMTPDFTCLCSTRSFDNDATKNLPRHHDIITAVSPPSFLYWKIVFFLIPLSLSFTQNIFLFFDLAITKTIFSLVGFLFN